jgi:hypothetical protein
MFCCFICVGIQNFHKMNLNFIVALIIAATLFSCNTKQDTTKAAAPTPPTEIPADTIKKSIPKEVKDKIGGATITIKYHAPAVRGRTIWGGLVPYGELWVTGAHKATSIEVDKPFVIGTKKIDEGKYGFFTIPAENNWKIIINKNWDQHLTDEYDEKDDVVQISVPAENDREVQERLYYDIADYGGDKGAIIIRWEKVVVAVPIEIK